MKLKHLPPANLNAACALLQPACNDELTPALVVAVFEAYNGTAIKPAPARLITLDDAASRLAVSTFTVKRWAVAGRLAGVKVGGHWRIRESAVAALVEGGAQ